MGFIGYEAIAAGKRLGNKPTPDLPWLSEIDPAGGDGAWILILKKLPALRFFWG
jgi:hypothetical protein